MEIIIIKPKNAEEAAIVLETLKQMNVETEVHYDRTDEEILDGIEQGAKETAEFIQGKRKLRSLKEFLNEL